MLQIMCAVQKEKFYKYGTDEVYIFNFHKQFYPKRYIHYLNHGCACVYNLEYKRGWKIKYTNIREQQIFHEEQGKRE